ncbi:MAG: four helix bundle protein [Bdellovibrionales bacterium]|nr:four helix bundle protein [Bdellovibrionales bacterium]
MARFKHLEIYQSAYKFTREVYRVKLTLTKNLKFDLGEKTLNSSLKIIRGLIIANGTKDRIKVLLQISLEIETLWVFLRMLFDFQGISRGEFEVLSNLLSNVAKQNQSWIKWSKEQVNKEKQ